MIRGLKTNMLIRAIQITAILLGVSIIGKCAPAQAHDLSIVYETIAREASGQSFEAQVWGSKRY